MPRRGKKIDIKKLLENVRWSRRKLETTRANRKIFLKEYVGKHYSDNGAEDKVPVDLVEMTVTTFLNALISGIPQANVRTPFMSLKPQAYTLELALNHLSKEIKLRDTIRQVVLEAFFSGMGIAKSGIYIAGDMQVEDEWHDVGQPFIDAVSMDDWVHDANAVKWDECQYMGNMYRLPLDMVMSADYYENTKELNENGRRGDIWAGVPSDAAAEISRGGDTKDKDEYTPMIDLLDLWLPLDGRVVTVGMGKTKPVILRDVEWEGPEGGPYLRLAFNQVLDNVMPLSPLASLLDMHLLINELYLKLGRQAIRQKTVLGVRRGADGDGSRIVDSKDGQALALDDPGSAKEYRFGGPDANNLAFAITSKQLYSWLAGNLDTLAGLGAQTDTVGQETILNQNASMRIQAMQREVYSFTSDAMYHLGWYLWYDPMIEIPLVKRVEGTDVEVPTAYTPEEREGDFLQYNISIEPYSLHKDPPAAILGKIDRIMQGYILPLLPMMREQGVSINIEALLRLIGKYSDVGSELVDILQFGNPSEQPPAPVGENEGPAKPQVTTRNYIRKNVPAASQQGHDQAMAKMLLGGADSVQPAELAGLMR